MKLGVFDSGLGGLTVLREILSLCPDVDVLYVADNKNAPYGDKTHEQLIKIVTDNIDFLKNNNCDYIVAACNSASSIQNYLNDYTEMTRPTAEYCANANYKNILLLATVATVNSHIYDEAFASLNLKIDSHSLPLLASLIDKGDSEDNIREIDIYIKSILENIKNISSYDAVILGCTHYPLVSHIFERHLYKINPKAKIVDPSLPVANVVAKNIIATGDKNLYLHMTGDAPVANKIIEEYVRVNFVKHKINLVK